MRLVPLRSSLASARLEPGNGPRVIRGLEPYPTFTASLIGDQPSFTTEAMEADMVAASCDLVSEHPSVGALLFECTNRAPYAHAVQAAVGLPIFDLQIQTLVEFVYASQHRRPYIGEL